MEKMRRIINKLRLIKLINFFAFQRPGDCLIFLNVNIYDNFFFLKDIRLGSKIYKGRIGLVKNNKYRFIFVCILLIWMKKNKHVDLFYLYVLFVFSISYKNI